MYRSTSLLALVFVSAEGRNYLSVIDHGVYQRSILDTDRYRYQLKIEMDPFFYPGEQMDTESPQEPTLAPVSKVWVTASPTESPSFVPSDFPSLAPTGPTSAPTTRENNVDGNGGCIEGTMLYQVNMYDSWGDGWAGTMLKIAAIEDQNPSVIPSDTVTKSVTTQENGMTVTLSQTVELESPHIFDEQVYTPVEPLGTVFEGGLRQGSHSAADVCLMPRRCYQVVVSGGEFLEEDSWDIRPVHLGSAEQNSSSPILEGEAPSDCTFSIPDENGISFCPSTCSKTVSPELTKVPQIVDNLEINEADHDVAVGSTTEGQEAYETRVASTRGKTLLEYLQSGHGNGQ